jgi:hypothetical protein
MTFEEWCPLRAAKDTPDPDLTELLRSAMRDGWNGMRKQIDAYLETADKDDFDMLVDIGKMVEHE